MPGALAGAVSYDGDHDDAAADDNDDGDDDSDDSVNHSSDADDDHGDDDHSKHWLGVLLRVWPLGQVFCMCASLTPLNNGRWWSLLLSHLFHIATSKKRMAFAQHPGVKG